MTAANKKDPESFMPEAIDASHLAPDQSGQTMHRPTKPLSMEDLEALSPEKIRRMFLELQVQQVELERQKEGLRGAREQLNDAKARHFELYELAQVGYCMVDGNGLILENNVTAARLLGVSRGEIVGEPISLFILAEDHHIFDRLKIQLPTISTIHAQELRMVHRDGTEFWARMSAAETPQPEGALVHRMVFFDITERKRTEEAIQHQRWRLASIIEGTHVGTWEWSIQTGETIFNERWAEIIGYTLAELQPSTIKSWDTFVHSDDLQRSADLLARHFSGELPSYECECRMKHKDGHWVWVLDRGQVMTRTSEGKPLMMFGTHTDITTRKQTEKALQRAHSQLELRVLERTADLEKTNATLAMMLDYARKTEMEIQERVVANIRSNIFGIVDILKKQELPANARNLVELLEVSTSNLANPLARNLESQLLKLTAREMQLANYIRLGKSTKELTALLNLSAKTVESHRNNLRKKLGLRHKKINLRTYLNAEFEK